MLDGVDPPVRNLDHLVERDERRLQRRQLHEQFHGASVVLLENLRVENDFKLTLCFLFVLSCLLGNLIKFVSK